MKKTIKFGIIIVFMLFLGLYFSYKNGYYSRINNEKMLLTEEKIREYENDLKNGVDVDNKNYLTVRRDYNNKFTNFFLQVSKKIENGLDGIIKFIFQKISNGIND